MPSEIQVLIEQFGVVFGIFAFVGIQVAVVVLNDRRAEARQRNAFTGLAEAIQQEKRALMNETARLRMRLEEQNALIDTLENRLKQLEHERDQQTKTLAAAQREIETLKTVQSARDAEHARALNEARGRAEQFERRLTEALAEIETLKQQIQLLNEEKLTSTQALEREKQHTEALQKRLESTEKRIQELERQTLQLEIENRVLKDVFNRLTVVGSSQMNETSEKMEEAHHDTG